MPRRSQGPRLYLDPKRKQWAIRDGQSFVRTGCSGADREGAEKRLAEYITSKYRPIPNPSPLIADVLLVYSTEHLPGTRAKDRAAHNISNLKKFWGTKKVANISADTCKAFAEDRPAAAARRDLELLRAAVRYWDKHKHPLNRLPTFWLPAKANRRYRWLTPDEARQLRRAAMKYPHLYRFVVVGLKTGSRSGVLFDLQWDWIDLDRGIMHRRAPDEAEAANKRTPPVKLGRALIRLLRRWQKADAGIPNVVHYEGVAIKKVRRSWAAACKEAKIKKASPHTLRHTKATWMMQAGIDPWEAAGSLGMSVRVLQTVYGHHHPNYQSNAAEI